MLSPAPPVPQVINIINAAQESSPMPVAEALDRVLEILRTTELYSPALGTKDEDPHTNDLVGGLMTVRLRHRLLNSPRPSRRLLPVCGGTASRSLVALESLR